MTLLLLFAMLFGGPVGTVEPQSGGGADNPPPPVHN